MPVRIGLDLDNTLINYDRAFLHAAISHGYLPTDFSGDKRAICNTIRTATSDGVERWQRLQGYVYGPGLSAAELFPGARNFIEAAQLAGAEVTIASHKTEYGHFDATRTPLRKAALAFLAEHGICELIAPAAISFSAELTDKLAAITRADCTHFIDDLEAVLDHPQFPAAVRGLWFAPNPATCASNSARTEALILRGWSTAASRTFAEVATHA